jgi:hypothetical protein
MSEATSILKRFGDRIKQIHISYVDGQSKHRSLNYTSVYAYKKVQHLIPIDVPIIIESPTHRHDIQGEISLVEKIFNGTSSVLTHQKSDVYDYMYCS